MFLSQNQRFIPLTAELGLANFYRAGGIIDKAEAGGLFLEFCKAVRERLSESKKIPKDTIECLILRANTR